MIIYGLHGFNHGGAKALTVMSPQGAAAALRALAAGADVITNSGPGRLTQALAIGPHHQRHYLDRPPLWIGDGAPVADQEVVRTVRVGISRARGRKLRFYVEGSSWVSRA